MALKANQTLSLGKATSWAFDVVGADRQEVIKVMFSLHGARAGVSREWTGFLNNESVERTLESMRYCGWTGDSFVDMTGMGSAVVELVLETREYNGKQYEQVRFVNRAPGLRLKAPMGADAVAAFSARMDRLIKKSKDDAGTPASKPVTKNEEHGQYEDADGELPF